MLVSQREYGRQKGWSHVYVGKLIKQGKIPTTDGKIDPASADAALAKTKSTAVPLTPTNGHSQPPREQLPVSYIQARTFHETYKAKKEKLEYEKLCGLLIEVSEVEKRQDRVNGNVAARLRAIPSKLAPQLVGVPNVAKVNAILTKEIYQVLEELVKIAGEI